MRYRRRLRREIDREKAWEEEKECETNIFVDKEANLIKFFIFLFLWIKTLK